MEKALLPLSQRSSQQTHLHSEIRRENALEAGCGLKNTLFLSAIFLLASRPQAQSIEQGALLVMMVPMLTFAIAAPSRLNIFSDIFLAMKGIVSSALLLPFRIFLGQRGADAFLQHRRGETEAYYAKRSPTLKHLIASDAARFHHARRLANLSAVMATFAGLSLPFAFPRFFTFGEGVNGAIVFGVDALVFGVAGKVVFERIAIRILESTHSASTQLTGFKAFRFMTMAMLLGATSAMVGTLVIVNMGALASAFETVVLSHCLQMSEEILARCGLLFVRSVVFLALPIGVSVGAVLGLGIGMTRVHNK